MARTVGSRDCLRAVCSECGLIRNECGLAGLHVCAECELKPALVCKPACNCLQAATASNGCGVQSYEFRKRNHLEADEFACARDCSWSRLNDTAFLWVTQGDTRALVSPCCQQAWGRWAPGGRPTWARHPYASIFPPIHSLVHPAGALQACRLTASWPGKPGRPPRRLAWSAKATYSRCSSRCSAYSAHTTR